MQITTNHPQSSYGVPVILDDHGEPMDYAPGVKAVRATLGLSTTELGEVCGVSRRTVEDWEQGRRSVSAAALNVMGSLINARPGGTEVRRSAEGVVETIQGGE